MLELVFLSYFCWAMLLESAPLSFGGGGAKEKVGKSIWSTERGSKISLKGNCQMLKC